MSEITIEGSFDLAITIDDAACPKDIFERAAEIARELKSEAWSHDAARVALDRAGIAIEAERGQQ